VRCAVRRAVLQLEVPAPPWTIVPGPALTLPPSPLPTTPPRPPKPPRHSQRVNERRFHVAATWGFGAVALALLPLALRSFRAGFAVLVFAAVGTYGAEGVAVSHYMVG
jgi:hypothetical protein